MGELATMTTHMSPAYSAGVALDGAQLTMLRILKVYGSRAMGYGS